MSQLVKERYDVVVSNHLLLSKYYLSSAEKVIVWLVLEQIDQSKPIAEGMEFYISAKDFAEARGINIKDAYRQLREAVGELYKRSFDYVEETKKGKKLYVQQRFTYKTEYLEGSGGVGLAFSPEIVKHLFELKSNYTKLNLAQVGNLSNSYTMRIYELLKTYKFRGEQTLTKVNLSVLMDMLVVPDSYSYGKFKERILIPAIEELNTKSLIHIELIERTKVGKKVEDLIFKCNWF